MRVSISAMKHGSRGAPFEVFSGRKAQNVANVNLYILGHPQRARLIVVFREIDLSPSVMTTVISLSHGHEGAGLEMLAKGHSWFPGEWSRDVRLSSIGLDTDVEVFLYPPNIYSTLPNRRASLLDYLVGRLWLGIGIGIATYRRELCGFRTALFRGSSSRDSMARNLMCARCFQLKRWG